MKEKNHEENIYRNKKFSAFIGNCSVRSKGKINRMLILQSLSCVRPFATL